MTASESDPILELDELLDPTRLAAAWQVARERAPVATAAPATASAPGAATSGVSGGADTSGPDGAADAVQAPAGAGSPGPVAALPVALAHRQLVDEIERALVASPGLGANARRVLAAPLARLVAALDPLDAAAAEAVLDDLEDVMQALLSAAGWPASGEE